MVLNEHISYSFSQWFLWLKTEKVWQKWILTYDGIYKPVSSSVIPNLGEGKMWILKELLVRILSVPSQEIKEMTRDDTTSSQPECMYTKLQAISVEPVH